VRLSQAIRVALTAAVGLGACTDSGQRYDNAGHLATAIERSSLGCENARPTRAPVRPGETQIVCTVLGKSITLHVMEAEDGLERIRLFNSGGNDDTPTVFYLYGDNWFIATLAEDVLGPLEAELGGDRADNTDF
jgi:hypothetical protein